MATTIFMKSWNLQFPVLPAIPFKIFLFIENKGKIGLIHV